MLGIGLQEIILLLPLVTIYLLASVTLVPFVASSKGRSGLAWMLIALLIVAAPGPHRAGCRATRRRPGARSILSTPSGRHDAKPGSRSSCRLLGDA